MSYTTSTSAGRRSFGQNDGEAGIQKFVCICIEMGTALQYMSFLVSHLQLAQTFDKEQKMRHTHLTALHCIALHCTALHCTALHCTALHCIAPYDLISSFRMSPDRDQVVAKACYLMKLKSACCLEDHLAVHFVYLRPFEAA